MTRPQQLTSLTVGFRDESRPSHHLSLHDDGEGCFCGSLQVALEHGSHVEIYVEVFERTGVPDVSVSITEGEEEGCSIRCTSGVVVSYVCRSGIELIVQVGSGPWE